MIINPTWDVVMYSSGAGSWAAAERVAGQVGRQHLILVFSDVCGEDQDNYRFLVESAADVFQITLPEGWKDLVPTDEVTSPEQTAALRQFAEEHIPHLVWLVEGRTIWEVFRDNRFLGNTRLANCSKFLKQLPAKQWLKDNMEPGTATIHVGIDWSEEHRLPAIRAGYADYEVSAPLCEPPYLDKDFITSCLRERGIEPPRLYEMGFAHANCGGGCVRAGQAQFATLLKVMPTRYAAWEAEEEGIRQYLDKDVAILRDRRGGTLRPLTLRAFRERHEATPEETDLLDIGGCGCFVSEEGQ